ncbi:MAG: protoporphyrinogen oxidase HemJ [Epsilonproteobacteria bacterium]|nr:protoporphyrinogen oxidase HemJ [Campylobacterota bacterium]
MEYYSWVLAFHVMSVISWMAMLFYLPRLFIYHVEHKENGKVFTDVIEIQERKLYEFIGVPAFWATLLSGIVLIILNPALFISGMWLHIKLTALLFLIGYHFSLNMIRKRLMKDKCTMSGKKLRFYNEVPTIIMIIVVIMVIIKPI